MDADTEQEVRVRRHARPQPLLDVGGRIPGIQRDDASIRVAQFAIQSAWMLGAGRVIAIDRVAERLEMARTYGRAETINFETEDVYDRLQAADLMTNAVIVASFVYHATNRDSLLPRKPPPNAGSRRHCAGR